MSVKWVCQNPDCRTEYAEYVNGCPRCYEGNIKQGKFPLVFPVRAEGELSPLCPDSPDGNHHVAPIGSDEEWMPSKAPCYYCGDKQAS